MLQFETSGKWPNELTAIQHIKAAFHIRLAELLRTKCSLITAASPKHVDVQKVRKATGATFTSFRVAFFELASSRSQGGWESCSRLQLAFQQNSA